MTLLIRNVQTDEIVQQEETTDESRYKLYRAQATNLNTREGVDHYRADKLDPTPEQKIEDGRIVAKTLNELVADGVITQAEADELAAKQVRAERDELLSKTDYMVLPDCPEDSDVVRKYRQALRDISEQKGFPHDIKWPEAPES